MKEAPGGRPEVPGLHDLQLPRLDWQGGLEQLCPILKKEGYRRVGLQLPEGLRALSGEIISWLEENLEPGVEILLWAEPSFGACDLADRPLEDLGAEALIHLGHTPMPYHARQYRIPVHFVPVNHTGELNLPPSSLAKIKQAFISSESEGTDEQALKLALVTTAQHHRLLPSLKDRLEGAGIVTRVGEGSKRLAFAGQILGCNFSSAWKVQKDIVGYLYLGTGRFHPLTLALGSKLPVVTLDPHSGDVGTVDGERFLRQRYASIAKAQEAQKWAILISAQIGQQRLKLAQRLQNLLKGSNRSSYLVAGKHQSEDQLTGLEVEAVVVTSCPRLAIEDGPQWPVPLLTPPELEICLGLREWDPEGAGYPFDEIL